MNIKSLLKTLQPHLIAFVVFLGISLIYFSPMLEGKSMYQQDQNQAESMQTEVAQHLEKTGEMTLWTNSIFGGMPAYLIRAKVPNNIAYKFCNYIKLKLPEPLGSVFLYFLGFYIMLLVFKVKPALAFIGGFAYAFATYNFINIEAGHASKVLAIGLLPLGMAGVFLVRKGKYISGAAFTATGLAMNIKSSHFQITYYLGIMILIYMIFELFYAIKDKKIKEYLKAVLTLAIAGIIALLVNVGQLWTTYEYSTVSTRGGSELTKTSEGKEKSKKGLDKDYVFGGWSYGKMETMTLLIPNFYGGATGAELDDKSQTYETLVDNGVPKQEAKRFIKQLPIYWGPMRFTSGPVYLGAIVLFLFFLGFFVIKNRIKWWILATTIISIMLAWGGNLAWFNDLFYYYFPFYQKFRVVSMIFVITQVVVPVLAIMALNEIMKKEISKKELFKAVKISFVITAGISLFFAILGSAFFDFTSANDEQLKNIFGNSEQAHSLAGKVIGAIEEDRASLLQKDALRSFIFILLAALSIWLFSIKEKIKPIHFLAAITIFIIADFWQVNKRYFNKDDFFTKRQLKKRYFTPTYADQAINKDKTFYRVLNLTVSPFNDATTSRFHFSIGGYHGAKMGRYQDIIEHHLSTEIQKLIQTLNKTGQIPPTGIEVMNMLNTKYFILGNTEQAVAKNPNNYGNTWLVNDIKMVENANEEIKEIAKVNLKQTAVVDKRFSDYLNGFKPDKDSSSTIKLIDYKPNIMTYESNLTSEGFAVFSEIYYKKSGGWVATVDGKEADHIRVNYILRGMKIPTGKHKIVFKFFPDAYYKGAKFAFAGSTILILLIGFALFLEIKKIIKK